MITDEQLTKKIQAIQYDHGKLAQKLASLIDQKDVMERQIADTKRDMDFLNGEANGYRKLLESSVLPTDDKEADDTEQAVTGE
jgi:uncharacterized coiled-coil DUF342 family protein